MDKDLLPWIFVAALIAAGAIAEAIEFSQHDSHDAQGIPSAPSAPQLATNVPPSPVDRPATPEAAVPSAEIPRPAPAPAGLPSPAPASAEASATDSAPLQPGQVWQCVVHGQKTFSDKRCGAGASVRQLGDLNVMHVPASASQPPYGTYQPGYAGSAYQPSASYPDDQDDNGNVDSEGYAGQALIVARERARRGHSHHREIHPHPRPNHGGSGSHTH